MSVACMLLAEHAGPGLFTPAPKKTCLQAYIPGKAWYDQREPKWLRLCYRRHCLFLPRATHEVFLKVLCGSCCTAAGLAGIPKQEKRGGLHFHF